LAYLLGLLAAASLYVGQHVYSVRQQCAVEALRQDVDSAQLELDRLTAVRDGLISLATIEPRARRLGLESPDLAQMARLPLDAPVLYEPVTPAVPPAFVDAVSKVWQWLDPPGISASEVKADE
jgi:hypothetical protein